jgi:hypothetical protein
MGRLVAELVRDVALLLICALAFSIRLFSVVKYEVRIIFDFP